MPGKWLLLLILFLLPQFLPAQELPSDDQPDTPSVDSDWDNYSPNLYTKGDKTFTITLGMIFPTYFSGSIQDNNHGLKTVGGTGSLSLCFFLNSHFFLGGELSGMFLGTKGGNMLYIIPMGLRVGYQFLFRRFEFPISLMIGGAPQKYLEEGYFGFILKPGASVFWRFSPSWSFGLNTVWWFAPQWPKEGKNVYGNFMELTLSARYHF